MILFDIFCSEIFKRPCMKGMLIYIYIFYPQYDQTASLKIKVSKINYGPVTVYYSYPL